jgi:hypothetical protein
MVTPAQSPNLASTTFAPMSARRLLIFGGIALIVGGMLFGDIFAVFVLHQNGGQTGEALLAASRAAAVGNSLAVKDSSSTLADYSRITVPRSMHTFI